MFVVFGLLLLMPFAIGLQIIRVQWLEGAQLRALWSEQAIDVISIPAQRGLILDSEGRELVGNTVTYTVAVDPLLPGTTRDDLNRFAEELAKVGTRQASWYQQRIRSAPPASRYVVLERNLSSEAADYVRNFDHRAVILEEQYRRRYNYESLASHVIGYVNRELNGMGGMEASYNDYLRGRDGERQVRRDRSGRIRAYVGAPRKQPEQGYTLVSTIDAHVQAIAEEELRLGVERARAARGSIVIMDPRTGAIKAMANYPSFDPNHPADAPSEHRRNTIVADMIEPGSTFKLVTAVAALENNLVQLDEQFDTGNGRRLISGQMMRDHDPLGTISFHEAIQKSSNIATSEVAGRVSSETFYQYVRNFGFGSQTYIDLPGEESGSLRKPWQWSAVTKPWLSIGYEVQVTPLQMAQAYAAFANNGVMMRPYIVEKVLDERGREVKRNRPQEVRRVIKPETIEKLTPVLESVVTDSGTAQFARIDGFRIAGKTGTAQKFIDGRYQARYLASFAGFFPADAPRYVCLVMLDEPRISYYGGFISGPVFRNVALRLIGLDDELHLAPVEEDEQRMWAVAPNLQGRGIDEARAILQDYNLRYRFRGDGDHVASQNPAPGERIMRSDPVHLTLAGRDSTAISDAHALVPDVRGMSMRKASAWLREAGFEVQMVGSGTVYAQFPLAGQQYRKGQPVTVRGRARDLPTILSHRGR
ncbi:penicillin-binding transpeptidase domain-containing protein [Balneolales bacterium ANBcel1]|nr:penicillin-binding transpeptidase domain-containing protein [Balneolales bacterium ANBcel1]